MRKLIFGLALALFIVYAAPVLACDCDTATGILMGIPDRLHSTWLGDPQRSEAKTKDSENGPKQEVQPMNLDAQPKGEVKK